MDRTQLVIVALPFENDRVRQVSSEKEPHLTLLYLGSPEFDSDQIRHVVEYVKHASSFLQTFDLEVQHRGELGPKKADVLFFNKRWSEQIETFRSHLLRDNLISTAYQSAEQFPEWQPHLTMGYPDSPAKENPEIYSVGFDRIAVWTENYSGPTFQLNPYYPYYSYDMEVVMSQIQPSRSVVEDILKHYGVKGMKWGVSRSQSGSAASSKPPASEDAQRASASRAKAKAGGVKALTTKELQDLTQRMNLEQQYSTLSSKEKTSMSRGHDSVKKSLGVAKTMQEIYNVANSPAGKALRKALIGT